MTFPIEYIPYVNTIILVVLLFLLITGFIRGFMLSLIDLLGTFALLVLAYFISPFLATSFPIAPHMELNLGVEALNTLIVERINQLFWFVLIFVVGQIVLLFLKPIVKAIGALPLIKQVNSLLGLVLGAVKGYVLALIVIFILSTPLINNGRIVVEQSWLGSIEQSSSFVLELLENPKEINEIMQNIMNGNVISEEDKIALEEWLSKNLGEGQIIQDILDALNKE